MVLKAEMQLQETEPSNFYSSPLIKTEEDMQSGTFEAFLSHHSVWGCQDLCYTTVLYLSKPLSKNYKLEGIVTQPL